MDYFVQWKKKDMPTPKQRLDIVLEYAGLTPGELSQKLEVDKDLIFAVHEGRMDHFPYELAERLNQKYKFNTKWLLDENKDIFDNPN